MNARFLVFLLVVVLIVVALVMVERGRSNPWNSDVFFGLNEEKTTHVMPASRATG